MPKVKKLTTKSGEKPRRKPGRALNPRVPIEFEKSACVALVEGEEKDLPDWFLQIPEHVQEILIARASGFMSKQIAEDCGSTPQAIAQLFKRYDPKGAFRLPAVVMERRAVDSWTKIESSALRKAKQGLDNDEITPYQALGQADMARRNILATRNAVAYKQFADASAIREKIAALKIRDAALPANKGGTAHSIEGESELIGLGEDDE